MADKFRYPQIPSTVWWGVRAILIRSLNITIDEKLLGAQLDVQEAAAKAYINELKSVGILTEDGRATALAERWRLDDSYRDAVEELVRNNYPEALLHIAPVENADRQKIVSWFLREGLGQGAAGNKAAAYLLIGSPVPNEAPPRTSPARGAAETPKPVRKPAKNAKTTTATKRDAEIDGEVGQARRTVNGNTDAIPLNVNLQIHISADAGSEQIESIFAAMRRYLYDAPAN
jgi:cell division septation protein DedD